MFHSRLLSKSRRKVGVLLTFVLFTVFLALNVNFASVQKTPIPIPHPEVYVEIKNFQEIKVKRISFYNPVSWQTDHTPEVSSCGPTVPRQIAISQDLFFDDVGSKHLCGTVVDVITDRGEVFSNYVINDTMNPRFTNTVDIMLPKDAVDEAFERGVHSGVLVIKD